MKQCGGGRVHLSVRFSILCFRTIPELQWRDGSKFSVKLQKGTGHVSRCRRDTISWMVKMKNMYISNNKIQEWIVRFRPSGLVIKNALIEYSLFLGTNAG